MDITNPTYLFYCERIIRKMMEHYAQNPAIIGYQVDNETTTRGVNNYDYQVSFVNYLKKKFGTPQNLNKIWRLNYWGMDIDGWEELALRDDIPIQVTNWNGNVSTEKQFPIFRHGSRPSCANTNAQTNLSCNVLCPQLKMLTR